MQSRTCTSSKGSHSGAFPLLLGLVYDFVLFAVIAASGRSGRYERYFALAALAAQIPFQLASVAFEGVPEVVATGAIDACVALFTAWLLNRRREAWLMFQLVGNVVGTPLGMLMHWLHTPGVKAEPLVVGLYLFTGALSSVQLAVLVLAVLRREFGPPYPLPRAAAIAA